MRARSRCGAPSEGGLGSGRLHVRLVALFTAIAAVPTVLVAIFASLLFQSGLEFWFSDRARSMLENTVQVARATYQREVDRVANETVTASGDLADYFSRSTMRSALRRRVRASAGAQSQPLRSDHLHLRRRTSRSARSHWSIPMSGHLDKVIPPERDRRSSRPRWSPINSADRIGAVTRLNYGPDTYLYMARVFDPQFREQIERPMTCSSDYQALLANSRTNQLKFNAALLLGALIIVGLGNPDGT